MKELRWLPSARESLRRIRAYVAKDSPRNADRLIERINKKAEKLRDFPMMGSYVEKFDRDDVREVIVGKYRLIYRVADSSVDILIVYHSARDLPSFEEL